MIQSYAVYVGTLLLGLLFAYRYEHAKHWGWLIALVLILTFVAGFRGESVGMDTENYAQRFEWILLGKDYFAFGFEGSFKKIVSLLLAVIPNKNFLFVFFAFVIYGCIFFRTKDCAEFISYPWFYIVFYSTFFFLSLNIMRQFCAVALVFFGTRYIEKKKYVFFLLCVLFAMSFHISAVLGILLLFSEVFYWKCLTNRQKVVLGAMIASIPSVMVFAVASMSKYSHYLDDYTSGHIGFLLPLKLVILLVSFFYFNRDRILIGESARHISRSFFILNVVGIFITAMGYVYLYVDRVGLYFYMFECLYVAMFMKHRPMLSGFSAVLFLLYSYVFISSMVTNGQGQMPYVFFWE